MKLQRVESRSVGDRSYYKYVLTLPEELVRAAGWSAGSPIEGKAVGLEIRLLPAKGTTALADTIRRESDYEQFRNRIRSALTTSKEGLTWGELRERLRLPQKVPNNVWVRRLERDIKLLRLKGPSGTRWRLE